MAVRNRLHRSELAVPGSNLRMLEKAPTAGADMVFLDLEDAVAPDDKAQARKNVIEALNDLDWSNCAVSIRINGLDTHYCYRDIVDVVEQAGAAAELVGLLEVVQRVFEAALLEGDRAGFVETARLFVEHARIVRGRRRLLGVRCHRATGQQEAHNGRSQHPFLR